MLTPAEQATTPAARRPSGQASQHSRATPTRLASFCRRHAVRPMRSRAFMRQRSWNSSVCSYCSCTPSLPACGQQQPEAHKQHESCTQQACGTLSWLPQVMHAQPWTTRWHLHEQLQQGAVASGQPLCISTCANTHLMQEGCQLYGCVVLCLLGSLLAHLI